MAYDYDELYAQTPNALGAPFEEFVQFFDDYAKRPARVLDLGCGQGRDALFIARAGHQVVAVDLAPHGIASLEKAAQSEGLEIQGVVADIRDFKPTGQYDVVLIDRTLHMLDAPDRLEVLDRIRPFVGADGWVLIADEKSNLPAFRQQILAWSGGWQIARDQKGFLFAQASQVT